MSSPESGVENEERISPPTLLECKFDLTSWDIVVFLTESGLKKLRAGGPDGLLSYRHDQTGATIEVVNDVSVDSAGGELQVICSPDPELLWFRVKISDHAYRQLQMGDIIMDRYDNGMGSRVSVVVDNEMVKMLTHSKRQTPSS